MSEDRTAPRSAGPETEELEFADSDLIGENPEEDDTPQIRRRMRFPSARKRPSENETSTPETGGEQPEGASLHERFIEMLYRRRYDVERLIHPSLRRRLDVANDFVWDNPNQRVVTYMGHKGGVGKTAVNDAQATYTAHELKGRAILLVDVNEGGGSTAYRLGIKRSDTMLLPIYVGRRNEINTYEKMEPIVAKVRETGLMVIASARTVKPIHSLNRGEMEHALEVLDTCSHSMYIDPGNPIMFYTNITAARFADVVGFVCIHGDEESYDTAMDDRDDYREEDDIMGKLETSPLVVLGGKEKNRKEYAERCGWSEEHVFVIPYDYHMAKRQFGIIRYSRFRLRTRVALAELKVFELKHSKKHEIDDSGTLFLQTKPAPVSADT